jgi:hypothetical protein
MSYSRWSYSTWYTYWSASSSATHFRWPTEKIKRGQHFEICDMPSYTLKYGDLKDKGINRVILEIREFYSKEHDGMIFDGWEEGVPKYKETVYSAKNPSEEEMLELYGYINAWQKDVDENFKFLNFIKNEWWYPARRKFYWKFNGLKKTFLKLFK